MHRGGDLALFLSSSSHFQQLCSCRQITFSVYQRQIYLYNSPLSSIMWPSWFPVTLGQILIFHFSTLENCSCIACPWIYVLCTIYISLPWVQSFHSWSRFSSTSSFLWFWVSILTFPPLAPCFHSQSFLNPESPPHLLVPGWSWVSPLLLRLRPPALFLWVKVLICTSLVLHPLPHRFSSGPESPLFSCS